MSIDLEFSRFATSYNRYSIIQSHVANRLISLLKYKPKKILDLGCGEGAIATRTDWEIDFFLGVDFAKKMLELHPQTQKIKCIYYDFENDALYDELCLYDFDYILSSSALQWAKDLNRLFYNISRLNFKDFAFGIFTSNTFKTIHKTANISSPIYTLDTVLDTAKKYFDFNYEVKNYTLEFEDSIEMFRYIKKSGVSGNLNKLSYKETKRLINEYPLNYLEFEVVFLYS